VTADGRSTEVTDLGGLVADRLAEAGTRAVEVRPDRVIRSVS